MTLFPRLIHSQTTAARLQVTILTSLVLLIANIGSGVVLARALGPTGRGIFTAATLFAPLIANIGGLGIAEALVYYSGRSGKAPSPALATALVIASVQSLVLALAGWMLVSALLGETSRPAESYALAYLAYIPLFFLNQYPLAVLQGRLRLTEYNAVRASVHVIYTPTLIVLWLLGGMSVGVAVVAALGSTTVTCALAIGAAAKYSSSRPSLRVARDLAGYGLRSHTANLATILIAQLDILVLTIMVSPRDLGNYTVATSAAMTASLVPIAASVVLFPTFANQAADAASNALAHFLFWGLGGALVIALALLLIVPWAVVPVYGGGFGAAAGLSRILVPAYLLRGSNQMLTAIIRGLGLPAAASGGQVVGLLILAALVPFGVGARGIEGAALAVAISSAVTFAWLLTIALRFGKLSPGQVIEAWYSDVARLIRLVRWRKEPPGGDASQ